MSEPPLRTRGAAALVAALVVVAVVATVRTWVAFPVRVDSVSMQPTYASGDVVLVSRTPPRVDDLRRGDLVVFPSPEDGRRTLKRVVGLPGDELVILDGLLHVNDQPVDEDYVDAALVDGYYSRAFEVPDDAVFVLGDNRGNSVDSRDYGAVPLDRLTGRAILTVWSPSP